MGLKKGAGFLAKENRGEGEARDCHAEGDQRDGAEGGRGDAHEEKRGSPDRREGKEDEDVGDAH